MFRRQFWERLFDLRASFRELSNPLIRRKMEEFIFSHATVESFDVTTVLVQEDHRMDFIYLVRNGFVIGNNHDEGFTEPKTTHIWPPNSIILLDHFLKSKRVTCEIRALAGAEVIKFARKDFNELLKRFPFIDSLVELRAGEDFNFSNVYFTGIDTDAKLRLEAVRKTYPDVERVVQKRELASFIGVSAIHFSRLLKK